MKKSSALRWREKVLRERWSHRTTAGEIMVEPLDDDSGVVLGVKEGDEELWAVLSWLGAESLSCELLFRIHAHRRGEPSK